jgi:hypothetical protein
LRLLGGAVSGEVLSFLILSFSLLFSLVCRFSCLLLALRFFLLLDDLFELFLAFQSSRFDSWALGFELETLCFLLSMNASRRRLRNQLVSSLV